MKQVLKDYKYGVRIAIRKGVWIGVSNTVQNVVWNAVWDGVMFGVWNTIRVNFRDAVRYAVINLEVNQRT